MDSMRESLIDTVHVRNTADLTIALFYKLYKNLGKNKTIHIKAEFKKK